MSGFIRSKLALLIATIALTTGAGSTGLAQEPMMIPAGVEVLTLDKAIDLALQNNRSTKNARLEAEKSDERLAASRTHLLPSFKLNGGLSKPLTTFDTTFEKGVFGTFPGTGPVPNEDTVITSSTKPTAVIVGQLAQPL